MPNTEKAPSQAAIGRALGLSPASITKCKQLGMPVHSVEAAGEWRADNLDPARVKGARLDPALRVTLPDDADAWLEAVERDWSARLDAVDMEAMGKQLDAWLEQYDGKPPK